MRTFASRAVFSPPYMPPEKMIGLSLRLRAQTLRDFFAFARLNRLPVYRRAILYHLFTIPALRTARVFQLLCGLGGKKQGAES